MRQRQLHLEAAYGDARVPNGLGSRVDCIKLVALVTGDAQPDEAIVNALCYTGGTWQNRVTWLRSRQAYLVVGRYDDDPNYGDTPRDLDRRLRAVAGDFGVSLRVHAYGKLVMDEGSLISVELAATAQLN